ncbi:MAG: MFS transporter [Candidatus Bathyarchaeota archaeon]|nr:MAG: MFS transporter [Candidatus Bathyarchaeota archaeon]
MNREVNLRLLFSVLLLYALAVGILTVVIPLYSYNLGADRVTVGFIFSAYALAYVAASPVWGKVSDRLGRKLALSIGMLGYSVVIALFTFVSNPESLVVIALLQGFSGASFWIVPTALIADLYASQEMGGALGKVALFQGIGFIVGSFLGGFLIEQLTYLNVFYICSAFAFSTALLILLGLQEKSKTSTEEITDSSRIGPGFGVIAKKGLLIPCIDTAFAALFLGVVESQFIVHAGEILMKGYLVGALLTSYYIAETFVQYPAGRFSDMIGRHLMILLAFIMSALGFLVLVFPPSFASLLFAAIAVGGGVGILYVAATALLMDGVSSSQRGLIAGFQNIAWGVGFFLGPMLGGIATIHSVSTPYVLCVVASAIGCALSLIAHKETDSTSLPR